MIPGAVAGAALVWLLRNWIAARLKMSIKSEYDQLLEKFKAELKHSNDVYLVELKAKHEESKQVLEHNLELARLEQQIRCSGSYQEVMDAIKKTHAILLKIQLAVQSYTSIFENANGPSKQERRKKLGDLVTEFWNTFNPIRIFFPDALDKEIVIYIKTINDNVMNFMLEVEHKQAGEHTIENWNKIDMEVLNHWNTVLASIREQFKIILGVERAS